MFWHILAIFKCFYTHLSRNVIIKFYIIIIIIIEEYLTSKIFFNFQITVGVKPTVCICARYKTAFHRAYINLSSLWSN